MRKSRDANFIAISYTVPKYQAYNLSQLARKLLRGGQLFFPEDTNVNYTVALALVDSYAFDPHRCGTKMARIVILLVLTKFNLLITEKRELASEQP